MDARRIWSIFRRRRHKLAAQYDAYEPLPGLHLNGKLTLDENIADLAGLAAAYDGYRAAYGGKEAPTDAGSDRRPAFLHRVRPGSRGKMRPETLRVIVMTDGHAPDEYRADTVRNLDAWYTAFNVKPGKSSTSHPRTALRSGNDSRKLRKAAREGGLFHLKPPPAFTDSFAVSFRTIMNSG